MTTDHAFPPIDESAVAAAAATALDLQVLPAPAVPTLRSVALAVLTGIKPALISLAARYKDVAFDLKTTAGLEAAKAARFDLRENGRFAVQRARDEMKDTLNTTKNTVEATADDLIAIVKSLEDKLDADITAREKEIATEKAEKKRLADERKARLEADLARILSYVSLAREKNRTAQWLADVGIPHVDAMTIDPEVWGDDFGPRATAALKAAKDGLRELHATVLAREQEAARVEEQRIENERVAAELAETRRKLEEQQEQLAQAQAEQLRQQQVHAHADTLRAVIGGQWDQSHTSTLLSAINDAVTGITVLLNGELPADIQKLADDALSHWNELDMKARPPTVAIAGADLLDEPEAEPAAAAPAAAPAPAAEPAPAALPAVAMTSEMLERQRQASPMYSHAATFAPVPAPAAPQGALHTEAMFALGAICAEIGDGFKMTEAFVETVLGEIAHKQRSAALYSATQRHTLLSALRDHIDSLLAV